MQQTSSVTNPDETQRHNDYNQKDLTLCLFNVKKTEIE